MQIIATSQTIAGTPVIRLSFRPFLRKLPRNLYPSS